MGDLTRQHTTAETVAGRTDISLSVVLQAAGSLVSSAEPDIVFESLVRRSAPLVCESATATVSRLDGRIHATSWPMGEVTHWSQAESVVTDFSADASGDYAGYHGLVSLRFGHQDESRSLVAQFLVERAMAVVERERLLEAAASRQATVAQLEGALTSNREIGVAVGILMVTYQLTAEESFTLLSKVSQRRNRKLREIAQEVVRVGDFDLPAGVEATGQGGRRRRLSSVAMPGPS